VCVYVCVCKSVFVRKKVVRSKRCVCLPEKENVDAVCSCVFVCVYVYVFLCVCVYVKKWREGRNVGIGRGEREKYKECVLRRMRVCDRERKREWCGESGMCVCVRERMVRCMYVCMRVCDRESGVEDAVCVCGCNSSAL